jgi:DNA polymerase III subunit epsilon
MSPLASFLRSRPRLAPDLEDRLQRLAEQSPPPTRNRHQTSRYVAVDIEATGQDPRRDRVLSIGAVSVDRGCIDLSTCFEVVLRQSQASSRDNILVHRIGGQQQLAGADPADALVQFLEYVAHAPLVAYRFEFSRALLDRTLKECLHVRTQSPWIDLARLLTALYPSKETRTPNDWLGLLGVDRLAQNDALADALATAQMLQVGLSIAEERNLTCPQQLIDMHRARPWFGRR